MKYNLVWWLLVSPIHTLTLEPSLKALSKYKLEQQIRITFDVLGHFIIHFYLFNHGLILITA
jgi:hypothetical protein